MERDVEDGAAKFMASRDFGPSYFFYHELSQFVALSKLITHSTSR
jgi:hypothetical protein